MGSTFRISHSVCGSLILLALAVPVRGQEIAPNTPVIVTNGEAIVRKAPDMAYVVLAVESRAKNPKDAQSQTATSMTAVQQRLAGAGIPRDAIRTIGLSLRQDFDIVGGRQVPRDYVARNGIEVRLDDIGRVGEIIDLVVQGGATSLDGVRFDLKNPAAAEREALSQAVADARARAEAAAAGAGRTIDRILRIEDSRVDTAIPRPYMARMAAAETIAPPTPVEPGQLEVRARVSLTVSMK